MKIIKKTLLFTFFLVAFGFLIGESVQAQGWLTGYDYRKEITISNTASAQTNYQMELDVNYGSGSDGGSSVYLDSHSQTDFDDIRFTKSDGFTELDYWREEYTASDDATFWIEFDSLAGSASTTFYIYYGNSSVSSASNGANTFIVFDDFERDSNGDPIGGDWTVNQGDIDISTEHAFGGTRSGKWIGGATNASARLSCSVSDNIAYRVRIWKESATYWAPTIRSGDGSNKVQLAVDNANIYYYDGSQHYTGDNMPADQWVLWEINDMDFTTDYDYDLWQDGSEICTDLDMHSNSNYPNMIHFWNSDTDAGDDFYIDDLIIRNFTPTEPTFGTWGTETESPPPGTYNVWGWAWSENIGWISFNSINCDADSDGFSDGTLNCPPGGTVIADYGVNIDPVTGEFSGYAWSGGATLDGGVGWMSFNQAETGVPLDFQADIGGRLTGWFTFLPYVYGEGWDVRASGFIDPNQNGIQDPGEDEEYEVWIDSNFSPAEFREWAWGDETVGWLSFNHLNCDSDEDGISDQGNFPQCPVGVPISDYSVFTSLTFNYSPYIESQQISYGPEYCTAFEDTGQVGLSWDYVDDDVDDQEYRFDFQVDNNSDFSSPEVDRRYCNLAPATPSSPRTNNQTVNIIPSLTSSPRTYCSGTPDEYTVNTPDAITYNNTTYYWRARVWDSRSGDSGWVLGSSFTTALHAYPWPDFSWTPPDPEQNETVIFDPEEDDPSTTYLWTVNELTGTGYQFVDGTDILDEEPHIQFLTTDNKVKLKVTIGTYSCEKEQDISAQIPLPEYKEVSPIIWLKKAFAAVVNFFNGFLKLTFVND